MEKVIKTNKGVFIRVHKGFGALIFSPFSGLFFAIKEKYIDDTIAFCNSGKSDLIAEIKNHIEIGINKNRDSFNISHYLPSNESFLKSNELPPYPIVINWLLSNKCNCKCVYCYADDVIDKEFEHPFIPDVAKRILDLNPLAVVISGGEPMLEKEKLIEAIESLGNHVGIIIDTNGLIWDDDIVNLLQKYNAVIRVSLDDIREKINSKVRIVRDKKKRKGALSAIATNIYGYRKNNIPVLIHTVVTSHNKKALFDLAEKLPKLGVNGWRIFNVIKPNDKDDATFDKALNYRRDGKYEDQIDDIKSKVADFKSKHLSKSEFSIEIIPTNDSSKNSVVLVLPDGKIVTELLFEQQKKEISEDSLFSNVNLWGHYERYLGKI